MVGILKKEVIEEDKRRGPMKVIIVGAGNIGFTAAETLCKSHDVLVIEIDAEKSDNIKSLLNVSVLHEDACNPLVLKSAIERFDADAIFSAVPSDPLNIYICQMARSFKDIKTGCSIRDLNFIDSAMAACDFVISPDELMSAQFGMIASLENAVSYEVLGISDMAIATFRVEMGHTTIVNKVVMDLTLPEGCRIVSIIRGSNVIMDVQTTMIHVGDHIKVCGTKNALENFNLFMGVIKDAKEFVIVGATVTGISTAKLLYSTGKRKFIKIIDKDEARCRNAIKTLDGVVVVNADIADPIVMMSENIDKADAMICVSADDERNLLACMAALRFNTDKIISKYTAKEYEEIFKYTGIEAAIGQHRLVTNNIFTNLMVDNELVIELRDRSEYVFSTVLGKDSPVSGKRYGDLRIPDGVCIVAVVDEDGACTFPSLDTEIPANERILFYINRPNPVKLSRFIGKELPLEL